MNILKNKNCNIKINDDNSNIVYVKTENGIFKCYKSETMHKPMYYPVNGSGYIDYNDVEKILTIDDLFEENQKLKNQQKEFIKYLEREKNRLAKECSHTYEDSLGRLLYVNEDMFNEVSRVLSKYKEIIGGDNK